MTQEKEKHFTEITRGMRDIYLKKNSDYGDSFSKSLDEFGQVAFIVRASDKMERMKSLHVRSQVVDDESLEDTVRDLANYCVMFLMWKQMEDYKDKKVKEKNIELPVTTYTFLEEK